MFLDNLWRSRSSIFAQTKVGTAPEIETRTPNRTPSALEYVSRNGIIRQRVIESFNPNRIAPGEVMHLPDQGAHGVYVCEARQNGAPALWLDPLKWQNTLNDFAEFAANVGGGHEINIEVFSHEPGRGVYPSYEWIAVSPAMVRGDKSRVLSAYSFGITQIGAVTFGNVETSFVGLGYLNPGRVKQELIASLIPSNRPGEF